MPWERHRYRKNKVWIEVDKHGAPVLDERGLAALRYKPQDERTYTVRPEEVTPLRDEEPPSEGASVEETPAGAPPGGEDTARGSEAEASEALIIYTDGASSGNPGPAGLGAVLLWRGHRREIQRFLGVATNNAAELAAVLAGLEAVKRPHLRVEVHTDSSYVIGVLTRGHRVVANGDLVASLRTEMERFGDLHFVKVPAHAGIAGNERADRLARDAVVRGAAGSAEGN